MTPTVLIVDDHQSFRVTARAPLEAGGFDVNLPDIDGFEVAARLASNGGSPAIVLTSSRDKSEFGGLVERSCACGFVPKGELSGVTLKTEVE